MSIKAINYVKDQARAGGFAQAVLLFLAFCHNADTGQCNPSRETIREFFHKRDKDGTILKECTMWRVENALKELREAGFIASRKVPCANGVQNWYTFPGLGVACPNNLGNPNNLRGVTPKIGVTGNPNNWGGIRNKKRKEREEDADAPLVLDSVSHNEATPNVVTGNDVTPKPEKKGSRITFTELTTELREQAIKVRPDLSPDQIAFEFDCFLDYWRAKAGSGAVKRDWPATWRNWIRRSNQFGANGGRRQVTQTQAVDEFKRAAVSTRRPEKEEEEEAAELLFG